MNHFYSDRVSGPDAVFMLRCSTITVIICINFMRKTVEDPYYRGGLNTSVISQCGVLCNIEIIGHLRFSPS